jgi:hypothetical protein
MSSWVFDQDPFEPLQFEACLATFKARLAKGEPVFQDAIKAYLLDNHHRVVNLALPSNTLGARIEQVEKDRLATYQASLGDAELAAVVKDCQALREFQEKPDTPEALKCVPSLNVADMPLETADIPFSATPRANGVTLTTSDQPTNGVAYLSVLFNLDELPTEYYPYLPLFCASLRELGTDKEDFVQLSQRIGKLSPHLLPVPYHHHTFVS